MNISYRDTFVKFETDKLDPCQCGFKPTYFEVAFGSTPYIVSCSVCKKQTNMYKYIGGCEENIIDFWNEIAPLREMKNSEGKRIRIYELEGVRYSYDDGKGDPKWHIRVAILDNPKGKYMDLEKDVNVYILFENGKIRMDNVTEEFLIKGEDY